MDKKLDKKLKSLFEYQKFEGDPNLNQIIKDSLSSDTSLLSDLQLNNVTAGSDIQNAGICPNCGSIGTYLHIIDKSTSQDCYYCVHCKYSPDSKLN